MPRYNSKFAFDAEDFHRGEYFEEEWQVKAIRNIEDTYLPEVSYLTAASPLIGEKYQKLYPNLNPVVVNNVFSLSQQPPKKEKKTRPIKFFWFSQTLGLNRGLQLFFEAIAELKDIPIETGLVGACSDADKLFLNSFDNSGLHSIRYHPLLDEDQLINICSNYDIGLALEIGSPLNRDICLTNKIFTYLLAGVAIIASETSAQKKFMDKFPNIGRSFPIGDKHELKNIITSWWNNPEQLEKFKNESRQLANTFFNWEKEQMHFLKEVERSFL